VGSQASPLETAWLRNFFRIATIIVSKRLTPLYESTAVIDIDRQTPAAVLGNESTAAVNSADVENYLTTQEANRPIRRCSAPGRRKVPI